MNSQRLQNPSSRVGASRRRPTLQMPQIYLPGEFGFCAIIFPVSTYMEREAQIQQASRQNMNFKKIYQKLEANKYILIGAGVGLLFWALESAVMSLALGMGDFVTQVFRPSLHEIWQRSLFFFLNFGAGIHFQFVMNKRMQAEARLRQRNRELAALHAVSTSISQSKNLGQILHDTLDEVLQLDFLGGGAKGMVFLTTPASDRMTLAASRGARFDHPCVANPPRIGECLCGQAAATGQMITHNFIEQNRQHSRHWTAKPHQDICLPLKARDQVLGVMNVRLPVDRVIGENETAVLTAVSDQIAIAIENAQLSQQKEQAITAERERIGRDLHDGLAQVLGYISTKTKAAQILLSQGKTDIANQYLRQLEKAAHDISLEVREAILGLKLTGQTGDGLNASMREMIRRFSRLSALLIHLNVADEVDNLPLTPETEIQLLRITQEALSNVRKHANATRAWVSLLIHRDDLVLTIADDGAGFDRDQIDQKEAISFGLANMQERAEMIRGVFELDAEVGAGTRVQVRLPQAVKVDT